MLTIRKEQIEALDRDKRHRFVTQMAEHVQKLFPKRYAALGEKQVREWIEHGIDRAESYGIVSERDVCKYVDVMIVFGRQFDQDQSFPWASKILNLPYTNPRGKTNLLLEAARKNASSAGTSHG